MSTFSPIINTRKIKRTEHINKLISQNKMITGEMDIANALIDTSVKLVNR